MPKDDLKELFQWYLLYKLHYTDVVETFKEHSKGKQRQMVVYNSNYD